MAEWHSSHALPHNPCSGPELQRGTCSSDARARSYCLTKDGGTGAEPGAGKASIPCPCGPSVPSRGGFSLSPLVSPCAACVERLVRLSLPFRRTPLLWKNPRVGCLGKFCLGEMEILLCLDKFVLGYNSLSLSDM